MASLKTAQTLGCGSVLLLVQELVRVQSRDLPRLWLVTRGAQAAGEEPLPLGVAQAPLWGLGRVIAQEHPTLWGGLIDLEPDDLAALTHAAASVVGGNLRSGWRGSDCVSSRAAIRGPFGAPGADRRRQRPPLGWRPDGSYLITGGLGDLGLLVARWMVEQGARRLILLGRTKLPPRSSWSSA